MTLPYLLLASNSPRRQELLSWTGWPFHVRPADIDENPRPAEAPGDYVLRLAEGKARAAAKAEQGACSPSQLILAADTVVVDGSELLGKPADPAEARWMLRRLRGRVHQVYTALAVYVPYQKTLLLDCCIADVPMRRYTDAEIESYIASGDPFDKAGGYAIQHAGFRPVEGFRDCYACVMGLPLCHLVRTLRRLDRRITQSLPGAEAAREVPAACQAGLGYDCPIYQQVLDHRR